MSWAKFKIFFVDHINFCIPRFSNGELKPWTWYMKVYWFCLQWPKNISEPCWCCAGLRGIILGGLGGLLLGRLL